MAGGFTVTISAVDKLTATLNDINKKTRETARPFRNLQASVQRFVDVSGLRNVGNAFRDVGRGARDAFDRIASIVAPLGAITGAASLAGMYRMVSAWSEWGSQLRNSSQSIGIAAQKLSAWEGAAQIGGAAAGSMTNALKALGQNMYDAVGGRNQLFTATMNGWHIAFRKGAMEGKNVADVFPQIADRIAKLKSPQAQATAAMIAFGGAGEALLPWIRRGSAGMREYEAEARKYLHVTQGTTDGADKFRMSQTRLTLAVQGLGNQMAERLAPSITPILDKFANWLATSPQVTKAIDTMGQAVQDFSGWLQSVDWNGVLSGMKGWVQSIKSVVDWLGGPKKVLEGLFILMGAKFAASMIAPWASLGVAIAQAGAIMGPGLLAMVASPAGAVVAAIAGIGVAGYELYKHWDAVKSAFSSIWNTLKTMFQNNTGYLRTSLEVLFPIPMAIIGHWKQIGPFFQNLWKGIKSAFSNAWGYVSPIIDKLKSAVNWIANSPVGKGLTTSAGWVKNQAERSVGVLDRALGFGGNANRPSSKEEQARTQQAMDYFQKAGWTRAQSAGIVANLRQESGLGERAVGDGGRAFGIAQWHADRQALIAAHFGKPVSQMSYQEQLQAVNYELTSGSERGAGANLRNAGSAQAAGAAVSMFYERPANRFGEAVQRGMAAESLAQPSGPPMQVASVQSGGQQSLDGTLSIKVQSDAGLKTSTVNQAGAFKTAKVAHSSVGEDGI